MKIVLSLFRLLFAVSVEDQHFLTKIWESDITLAVPESACILITFCMYPVIDGQKLNADVKREIARLDGNGKITSTSWVVGLDAPKVIHPGK